MIILLAFAFIAGVVTVLSPCILPVLPIILSASVETKSRKKPIGVIIGFILSFTFFTLFLTTIIKFTNIPADVLRVLAVIVIAAFGLTLVIPKFQVLFETLFSKLSVLGPKSANKEGFYGGLTIGLSLGLLWTPCVGPILASVISLALIGEVSFAAFLITLAYSLGTSIPMFLIMLGGSKALQKVPFLSQNTNKIQKAFGVLMLLTSLAILTNLDRKFQTFILTTFPNYGTGLTKIEENNFIKNQLDKLFNKSDMQEINSVDLIERKFKAPEIVSEGKWFNSESLTLSNLRGKVVLIDFWTYSCINCQRTLPYLTSWHDKYKDLGLVIIGVHAPEFEFEKDAENVLQAISDFKIEYPVVQDNNFLTWRAYGNSYWPAKYLIDKEGYIRYYHFGEGAYDETEEAIQLLLKESGVDVSEKIIDNPEYQNFGKTPELYLGYSRISNLISPQAVVKDAFSSYTAPISLPENKFSFSGDVLVSSENANFKTNSFLELNFDAKNVYLVMASKEGTSKVKVYLDNVELTTVEVTKKTLYELINLEAPGRHILKLEFLDNTEAYAFTFG